ncbi:hypothetical protein HY634_00720 [Candidatus Uhrbacteria bacterium]|nr:hypothetical protein [Candidatus Uhrbacteria bacterium]
MSATYNERSRGEGALLLVCGILLTGLALLATASAPDGWFFARELLKISLPTCGLGLLLATGVLQ